MHKCLFLSKYFFHCISVKIFHFRIMGWQNSERWCVQLGIKVGVDISRLVLLKCAICDGISSHFWLRYRACGGKMEIVSVKLSILGSGYLCLFCFQACVGMWMKMWGDVHSASVQDKGALFISIFCRHSEESILLQAKEKYWRTAVYNFRPKSSVIPGKRLVHVWGWVIEIHEGILRKRKLGSRAA